MPLSKEGHSYRRHYPLVSLGNSPHNDIIKEALMPTVSISFLNLRDEHGNIRTFAYKDSPEWSETGTCDDFRHHEVLELLARLGMADKEAQELLELIIQEPRIQRRQFRLTAEQFTAASESFQQPIP